MCHLKGRTVTRKSDAIIAYHDNDDHAVCIKEADVESSIILECECQGAVEEAADLFFGSGAQAIYVMPA